MSELPLVSVIVPSYEREEMTRQAVLSALAQDYPNLEVLLVDDASPTARHAQLAALGDPRLRLLRNKCNLGRVANYRHALYELARGEWVVNLDGDDYFSDPGFVSAAMKRVMQDSAVVIVAARCTTVSRHGRTLSATPGDKVVEGIDVVAALPRREYLLMHLATLYKRKPALSLDFYRSSALSSDWESLYRLAVRGRVAFLDRDVGVWRIHGENASGAGSWQMLVDNLSIWPGVFEAARSNGMNAQAAESARRHCLVYFGRLQLPAVMRSSSPRADIALYLCAFWRLDRQACGQAMLSFSALLRLGAGLLGYYRMRAF